MATELLPKARQKLALLQDELCTIGIIVTLKITPSGIEVIGELADKLLAKKHLRGLGMIVAQ